MRNWNIDVKKKHSATKHPTTNPYKSTFLVVDKIHLVDNKRDEAIVVFILE